MGMGVCVCVWGGGGGGVGEEAEGELVAFLKPVLLARNITPNSNAAPKNYNYMFGSHISFQ